MNALRAHTRGGPEVLVYESAPRPRPGRGDVLVAVHAAAITFAELTWAETWTRAGSDRTPIVPSHEFSGVVSEIGAGVGNVRPGDAVYGLVPFDQDGAAADFVVVPSHSVVAKPEHVSHLQAAAVPLAALTAWQALFDQAGLVPGERVLVHGAAGGVGAYAAQLASEFGAEVTATARGPQLDYVSSLGVARVVVVDDNGGTERLADFDVVIDTVGGMTLDRSFTQLRRGDD
jgi:NADPH:quinone reductase-like Zn-dependent oxidoreductase